MSILDEYQIKTDRTPAAAAPENPEQTPEVTPPAETPASEPVQETTPPAEPQATTNHTPVEPAVENPVIEFANEEIAKMNSYLKKYPEKTIDDYKTLTTPVESLKEEDLLRSYLSEKEGKTKSQIDYTLKNLELKEGDPDFDGEFENPESDLENLKKKGDKEALLEQAKKWREEFVKSELSFDNDNQTTEQTPSEQVPSIEKFIEDAKLQQQAYTENYRTEIYKVLPTLDKIDLEINGKIVSFVPDENFKTEMRRGAEDISQIGNEYFDESANIKDAKGFITNNTLWANPKTRQPMIDFMIEQAVLNDRAINDKARRNITLDDASGRSIPQSAEKGDVVDKIFSRNRGSF